jgi:putative membrane-bound dehydrogenase-like protein
MAWAIAWGLEPIPPTPSSPLSPREELASFCFAPGFRIELAAAEPEVVDPVALTFDEEGRLYVVEMRGYPNGGIGEGLPRLPGRVKLLEDGDGDGYYEKAVVFLDDLRFPSGICVWNRGVFVADAPDLLWCADRDGDGRADVREVVYTGFGAKNIQGMVNGLQYGLDNWIHGCMANDSLVAIASAPDRPKLSLRGRHFRFDPRDYTRVEATSGGGQYGLACDDWGNWFTCTNNQHLRHIVLPEHYLRRNPHVVVPRVVADIPDGHDEHTPAAKVFRISPPEAWRVERTNRRVNDPEMQRRLPASELVPAGYITSATGLTVYRGGAFPPEFEGNVFVADPANNLVHRDVLLPVGASFIAKRHESERQAEFLASRDPWFRPVFLAMGPDGALYVCDFYREIIETPLSLPDDIQKRYHLDSWGRGRIWRIVAEADAGTEREEKQNKHRPALGRLGWEELTGHLAHANAWHRMTAQRLLVERQAREASDAVRNLARGHPDPRVRVQALWTLAGLQSLEPGLLLHALLDRSGHVREHALRLAEPWLEKDPRLRRTALRLVEDPMPRVRFQLAFTLGEMKADAEVTAALATLARKDAASPWVRSAILSSAVPHAAGLMRELERGDPVHPELLAGLASTLAATSSPEEQEAVLREALGGEGPPSVSQSRVVEALGQALHRKGSPLVRHLDQGTAVGQAWQEFFQRVRQALPQASGEERLGYIRLLGLARSPWAVPILAEFLAPHHSSAEQVAALQALSWHSDASATDSVLAAWNSFSPTVRREAQEMLFARPERLKQLLDAVESRRLPSLHLDPARRDFLLQHPDASIRSRAARIFAEERSEDRGKVLARYREALNLPGDPARGKRHFQQHCAGCHRLDNIGHEVGPDLLPVLKTRTAESLLTDILDPSREVDARYLNYVARTTDGRILTGIIASETAASLVLRRAEQAEDQLLRAELEEIRSTSKSLMPEGLEQQLSPQDLADLLAYLLQSGRR